MSELIGGSHGLEIFTFFVLLLVLLVGSSEAAGREMNPALFELSSREELEDLAGYGEHKLSTVLVTGTVLCEACLDGQPQLQYPRPVSGALVGVTCDLIKEKMKKSCWARGMTDEYGDFIIDLPSRLHAIPDLDKTCRVVVVGIPKNSVCKPASAKREQKHINIKLSSVGNGIRTYTAGKIRSCIQHRNLHKHA